VVDVSISDLDDITEFIIKPVKVKTERPENNFIKSLK
jgi:hypothetical protein